jgi:hypothetical protein
MSYASSFEDLNRNAASYVDRLLRGAKVPVSDIDWVPIPSTWNTRNIDVGLSRINSPACRGSRPWSG